VIDLATFDFVKLEEELYELFVSGYTTIKYPCPLDFVNNLIKEHYEIKHKQTLFDLFEVTGQLYKRFIARPSFEIGSKSFLKPVPHIKWWIEIQYIELSYYKPIS
jgi:hypothetical protein